MLALRVDDDAAAGRWPKVAKGSLLSLDRQSECVAAQDSPRSERYLQAPPTDSTLTAHRRPSLTDRSEFRARKFGVITGDTQGIQRRNADTQTFKALPVTQKALFGPPGNEMDKPRAFNVKFHHHSLDFPRV